MEICVKNTRSQNNNLFMTSSDQNKSASPAIAGSSISPWLSVQNSLEAANFYTAAFNAIETYHLDTPDGTIVRFSVNGAEFWVSSGESAQNKNHLGGGSIRMILTVPDPDALFANALKAGAAEIFPVHEEHGWRVGRIIDPFGLHWEIGRPVE
jgi:PhnB protein